MAKKNVLDSLMEITEEETPKHIQKHVEDHIEKEEAVKKVKEGRVAVEKKAGRKPARGGEKASKQVPLYLTETDYEKLRKLAIRKDARAGELVKEVFLKWLDRQKLED